MRLFYNWDNECMESETTLENAFNENINIYGENFNNCYGDFDHWVECCQTSNNGSCDEIFTLVGIYPNMSYYDLSECIYYDDKYDRLVHKDILIKEWKHSNSLESFPDWLDETDLFLVDCTDIAEEINAWFEDFKR